MYKATKQWQPNRYMQQFVRDGIIYFLMYVTPFPSSPTHWDQHNSRVPTQKLTTCYFPRTTRHALYNINVALLENNLTISSTSMLFLTTFCYIMICPMMPRFIISVRELYDRDLRHCWQGIDTGFSVLSQPIFSENTVGSVIAFACHPREGAGGGVRRFDSKCWEMGCRVWAGSLGRNGKGW